MEALKNNWVIILLIASILAAVAGWWLYLDTDSDYTKHREDSKKKVQESEVRMDQNKLYRDSLTRVDEAKDKLIDSLNLTITNSAANEVKIKTDFKVIYDNLRDQSRTERNSFFTDELSRSDN